MSRSFVRTVSSYQAQLALSRKNCVENLRKFDKSSYILGAYIPSPVRDSFFAIKSFNLEVSKIQEKDGIIDFKVQFWKDLLYKVFEDPSNDSVIGEPIAFLLRDSIRNGFNIDIQYFNQILTTKQHVKSQYLNTDEICSYGEGFYSQSNYLVQNLLLSKQLSPSTLALVESDETLRDLIVDIQAHIGQATAIASIVLGTEYYARHQNKVLLPVDIMTKHDVSQESLLRLFQGHEQDIEDIRHVLKDVVYETCIVANDHLLTARSKLAKVKQLTKEIIDNTDDELITQRHNTWKGGLPDCLFVPFMSSIPLNGYLKILEKNDFDIIGKKIENSYWRLIWNSYRSYNTRNI